MSALCLLCASLMKASLNYECSNFDEYILVKDVWLGYCEGETTTEIQPETTSVFESSTTSDTTDTTTDSITTSDSSITSGNSIETTTSGSQQIVAKMVSAILALTIF